MSGKTTGKVWDLKLTPAKQIVLLALADKADQNDEHITPGIPLVSWMTGYSERQVQRIVKSLIADGLLVVTGESARHKPTSYRINVAAGIQKPLYVKRSDKMSPLENDKMSPLNEKVGVTSHGRGKSFRGDIDMGKTASNGKENGIKEKKESDSLSPSIANALDNVPTWSHDDNDTILQMQADGLIQAFENAHRESGAPQTVRRGKDVYKAAIRYWKDGYSADEVYCTTRELIDAHKPLAFVFIAEALAAHRIKAKPIGIAVAADKGVPFEQQVDTWIRKS